MVGAGGGGSEGSSWFSSLFGGAGQPQTVCGGMTHAWGPVGYTLDDSCTVAIVLAVCLGCGNGTVAAASSVPGQPQPQRACMSRYSRTELRAVCACVCHEPYAVCVLLLLLLLCRRPPAAWTCPRIHSSPRLPRSLALRARARTAASSMDRNGRVASMWTLRASMRTLGPWSGGRHVDPPGHGRVARMWTLRAWLVAKSMARLCGESSMPPRHGCVGRAACPPRHGCVGRAKMPP